MGYIVPRTRYEFKSIRNESSKGVDVIGFKFRNSNRNESPNDRLCTFEVKCALSGNSTTTLSRAINDSKKDFRIRKAESLNAMKQRLMQRNDVAMAQVVNRFSK